MAALDSFLSRLFLAGARACEGAALSAGSHALPVRGETGFKSGTLLSVLQERAVLGGKRAKLAVVSR
ncbi:MAG: hypothetical protein ACI89J_000216 [Hyphomicrobiaceae bacterium]|jgi:hypothetical protein